MTTGTITDEDGRTAQYTLTPNFGGMTMTVNTEEAKAFDAVLKALERRNSNPASRLIDIELIDAVEAITGREHMTLSIAHAFAQGVQAAYEAGKREAVPQWQPIETAPENGDVVLVYREDAGVFTAHFVEEDAHLSNPMNPPEGDFYWFSTSGEDLTDDMPTHWMPLPASPKAGE